MSARRSRFAVVLPRPQPVSANVPPVVIVASIVEGARSIKETVSLGPDPKMPVLKISIPRRLPGAKYVIPCWAATRRVVLSALSNDVVSVPRTTVIASPQSTDVLAQVAGYTKATYRAMDPLECVDEATQREQTTQAHRRWRQEQKRAWGSCHASIIRALSEFHSSGPIDRAILKAARGVDQAARRVDRRVDELGR